MTQLAAKFRKKPVIIEAMPFDGTLDSAHEIVDWIQENKGTAEYGGRQNGMLLITTLEGDMFVSEGDWVIKGVSGEFYPCKPEIFEKTYEPTCDPEKDTHVILAGQRRCDCPAGYKS